MNDSENQQAMQENSQAALSVQSHVDKDARQASKKKCISCGADQLDDGSLPCGHDNDL